MKGEESLTNFTIEFYKTCNGKCPVSEFLDSPLFLEENLGI